MIVEGSLVPLRDQYRCSRGILACLVNPSLKSVGLNCGSHLEL